MPIYKCAGVLYLFSPASPHLYIGDECTCRFVVGTPLLSTGLVRLTPSLFTAEKLVFSLFVCRLPSLFSYIPIYMGRYMCLPVCVCTDKKKCASPSMKRNKGTFLLDTACSAMKYHGECSGADQNEPR